MKRLFVFAVMVAFVAFLVSCAGEQNSNNNNQAQTGTTEKVAKADQGSGDAGNQIAENTPQETGNTEAQAQQSKQAQNKQKSQQQTQNKQNAVAKANNSKAEPTLKPNILMVSKSGMKSGMIWVISNLIIPTVCRQDCQKHVVSLPW